VTGDDDERAFEESLLHSLADHSAESSAQDPCSGMLRQPPADAGSCQTAAELPPASELAVARHDASGMTLVRHDMQSPSASTGETARTAGSTVLTIPPAVTAMIQELTNRARLGEQRRWTLRLEGVGKKMIQIDVVRERDDAWLIDVANGSEEDEALCRQLRTLLRDRLNVDDMRGPAI